MARNGGAAGLQALEAFLQKGRIGQFAQSRNDPNEPQAVSGLSPYIHFGQLGMQRAALQAIEVKSKFRVSWLPQCRPAPVILVRSIHGFSGPG